VARSSEPIFNVPPVILWLIAVMAVVHGVRSMLGPEDNLQILLWFAFIPARYDAAVAATVPFPGGIAADIWTFVTHAFLHAEIVHLLVNTVWLLAFGSPVAWRFGPWRFLAFFAATAAAGAATFLFMHQGEIVPVIGASGAISGAMAAACRFVFSEGGPLSFFRGRDANAYKLPALPLIQSLRNRQVIVFLLAWFGLNLMFGVSSLGSALTDATVAWEAHVGGFLAGLLLFRFFDPVPRLTQNVPLAPTGGEEED
jgi:membrane associated rhomboid family serine protease